MQDLEDTWLLPVSTWLAVGVAQRDATQLVTRRLYRRHPLDVGGVTTVLFRPPHGVTSAPLATIQDSHTHDPTSKMATVVSDPVDRWRSVWSRQVTSNGHVLAVTYTFHGKAKAHTGWRWCYGSESGRIGLESKGILGLTIAVHDPRETPALIGGIANSPDQRIIALILTPQCSQFILWLTFATSHRVHVTWLDELVSDFSLI